MMPIAHDYRCIKCQRTFEAMVDPSDRTLPCPTCGDGVAERVYLSMGGMLGKSKGLFPAFDIQSGQTFESSKDRDDYAYKRGRFEHREGPKFEMLGPQEWNRSRNAPSSPNPMDSDEPDPELIEIAKRAWDDVKYDRLPKEVEEDRVVDAIQQSDFLDATPTKPIQTDTGLLKIQ
jgi:putative FmdB family regulatory protein